LSANLLGHNSLILILGKYWFWILLAFIAGRLLKQYTHRIEDGLCPNTFSPGALVVMILIIGAGLAASFAGKNGQGEFNLRLGGLTSAITSSATRSPSKTKPHKVLRSRPIRASSSIA